MARISGEERSGDTLLESTGTRDASDRYLLDIAGGAGRITVAEVD